jgi:hypothetical protein
MVRGYERRPSALVSYLGSARLGTKVPTKSRSKVLDRRVFS